MLATSAVSSPVASPQKEPLQPRQAQTPDKKTPEKTQDPETTLPTLPSLLFGVHNEGYLELMRNTQAVFHAKDQHDKLPRHTDTEMMSHPTHFNADLPTPAVFAGTPALSAVWKVLCESVCTFRGVSRAVNNDIAPASTIAPYVVVPSPAKVGKPKQGEENQQTFEVVVAVFQEWWAGPKRDKRALTHKLDGEGELSTDPEAFSSRLLRDMYGNVVGCVDAQVCKEIEAMSAAFTPALRISEIHGADIARFMQKKGIETVEIGDKRKRIKADKPNVGHETPKRQNRGGRQDSTADGSGITCDKCGCNESEHWRSCTEPECAIGGQNYDMCAVCAKEHIPEHTLLPVVLVGKVSKGGKRVSGGKGKGGSRRKQGGKATKSSSQRKQGGKADKGNKNANKGDKDKDSATVALLKLQLAEAQANAVQANQNTAVAEAKTASSVLAAEFQSKILAQIQVNMLAQLKAQGEADVRKLKSQ
jgi:hypothetical protein